MDPMDENINQDVLPEDATNGSSTSPQSNLLSPRLAPLMGPGGGGGTDPSIPPTIAVAITSAIPQTTIVGPNTTVVIHVTGTVSVEPNDSYSVTSPAVTVNVNSGASITAPVDVNGNWSATISGVGSGTNTVTAIGSISYKMTATGSSLTKTGVARATVTITLDNTPPQFAVTTPPTQVDCPTPGTNYSLALSGTASDTQTGIAWINITLDGTSLPNISNPPQNWSTTVNIPAVVGNHTVTLTCSDGVGNKTTQGPFTIALVDHVPPEIRQVNSFTPPVIDNLPITLHVSGTVIDVHSGVQWVKVRLIDAVQQKVIIPDTQATISGAHGANQLATWAVDLPNITTAGSYTVSITAADVNNNTTAQALTVPVTIQSIPTPVVVFTVPDPVNDRNKIYPDNGSGVSLHVEGTARADLSTLTNVTISIDNGSATPVKQKVSGSWTSWYADITIPHSTADSHVITVQATNSAQNPQFRTGSGALTILVAQTSHPQDTEDNISQLAYLRTLLTFATQRVMVGTQNLTVANLVQQFYQPFADFKADEDVQTIRVCAEVLRAYLAANTKTVPASAETNYRQIAYEALLNVFGTSYAEVRLARSATNDVRQALATRLGIVLQTSRPDQLDMLLLQAGQFTEANLESLFGYLDTHRSLTQPDPSPAMLAWQQAGLRSLWRQQDQASTTPIIDPDLITKADLLSPTPGNAAYDLWNARTTWVQTQLTQLAANTQPNETAQARFDRLLNATLAPTTVANLLALDASQQQGNMIDDSLAQIPLSRTAFTYLIRMRALAGSATLLDSEWQDIYFILIQVMKAHLSATWKAAESALTLGPDYFLVSDPTTSPSLPSWRATVQDRQNWSSTLQARIDQLDTLNSAYEQAILQAETVALPVLRDALITAATPSGTTIDMINWLTERLLIDVNINGTQKTSRITQAIETVQGILTSLRDGRFQDMNTQIGPNPAATWTLAEAGATFDQEWTWMGTYANWRAAMLVFIYPENLLRPSLRNSSDMTKAFSDFLDTLRTAPTITPQFVRDTAAQYLTDLRSQTNNAPTYPAVPAEILNTSFVITEQLAETDLASRATLTQTLFQRINKAEPGLRYITEVFFGVPVQIALMLEQAGQYSAALDWYRSVYAYNLPLNQRRIWYGLVDEQSIQTVYETTNLWLIQSLNPHQIAQQRAGAYTRFTIMSIVNCFLDYADAEFASDTSEAVARARALYINALDLLNSTDMQADTGGYSPNPIPQSLLQHANLNLFKIRTDRNSAGMQRQLEVRPGSNASSMSSIPSAQSGSAATTLQPTPYRYSTLIDRAKQLASLAQQMEASYLQALEKADAETYTALQARQNLDVTLANVQLQNLRVTQANDGVKLATLQQQRAQIQQDTYQSWINAGPSQLENAVLNDYASANEIQNVMTGIDAAITAAQAITTAASGGFLGTGLGAGDVGAGVVSALSLVKAGAQIDLNNVQTSIQSDTLRASWERRQQEWQLQLALARQDVAIGQQQIVQAKDSVAIATQEFAVTQMQANHAQATVDFLSNKFTNADLYEWMSGILGRVYSYFLQQATAVARLAQSQLAFERQETPLSFIQSDYWQTPSDAASNTDRRGLTGSARLLQDIYQLDQYAFETNKRKLQLTKTFSLARLAPFEFAQFRQSGVLTFATPMALFDQDFPGHYLRLIKRVRTSVIALIPPYQGIKATLSSAGVSRVVVGNDTFQTLLVQHEPESIALCSPTNATGVFDLDPQSDMLLPFEGLGVDTTWEFQMPRAANAFDYTSIADIMLTVDYTALASTDYRQQVIQTLNRTVSADRPYSLRQQFPDAWYDLNNVATTATNVSVSITTVRDDFPSNIDQIRVQQLALYIDRADGATFELSDIGLQFTPAGSQTAVGGSATTIDGIISTRRGNAAGWLPIASSTSAPIGTWQLTIPQAALASHLANGDINDILLIITYTAQTPAWPA